MHDFIFVKKMDTRVLGEVLTPMLTDLVKKAEELEGQKQVLETMVDRDLQYAFSAATDMFVGIGGFITLIVLLLFFAYITGEATSLLFAALGALAFYAATSAIVPAIPRMLVGRNKRYTMMMQHMCACRMWINSGKLAVFMERRGVQVDQKIVDKITSKAPKAISKESGYWI